MAKFAALLLLVGLAGFANAGNEAVKAGNPMAKVIGMLEDLLKSIKEEGEDEAKTYDEFSCYCKDENEKLSDSIKDGEDKINSLSADIEQMTAEVAMTESEVDKRTAENEKLMNELEASRAQCLAEAATFEATSADLTKALDQLDGAIKALEDAKPSLITSAKKVVKHSLELAYALNLADREATRKPIASLLRGESTLTAFVQGESTVDPKDPEYKSATGKVIAVIEDLKKDFEEQLQEAQDENKSQKKACKDMQTNLAEAIGKNREAIEKMKEKIEDLKKDIASTREELEETQTTLKEDDELLAALTKKCHISAKTWDQRASLRGNEVKAIEACLTILKDEVQGKYDETVDAKLIQERFHAPGTPAVTQVHAADATAPSFLQVRDPKSHIQSLVADAQAANGLAGFASAAAFDQKKRQITDILTTGSKQLKSPALSALAMRINAQVMEPVQFKKVKMLIQDLIQRILDEMAQDASKKGWCDTAVGVAVSERNARNADGLKMSAELTELESKKADLKEELEELSKSLKELAASLAEAAKLREEEKAENLKKLATAREGKAALEKAIEVLKAFYMSAKHKKVTLIQAKKAPEPGFEGGEAYTGKNDESSKIIGMLEEVKADFERTIKDTEDQEAEAHADFVEFERATKSNMSGKNMKTELNTQDLETTESAIKKTLKDLKTNQELMDAAIKEIADLKPACDDIGMSYEERVKQREEEVALLKKCICLFDGDEAKCGFDL